jgi:hypothetical protein
MRRALAGLLSVAVVAFAAQAAIVSSSAAPRASDAIVCPLEPAGIIPCCGPPVNSASDLQPICCPLPTAVAIGPCPIKLTIVSTPDPSTAGKPVTVSGHLFTSVPGETVFLWQRLPSQRDFHSVASTTPDSSGAYTFVRAPIDTNRRWYVAAGGVDSATLDQQVAANLTLSASATTAKDGTRMILSGHVTPTHAGERLVLERRVGHGWQIIESARIGRASDYAMHAVFTRPGRLALRAVLPADNRNTRSTSPVLALTIA